jgi:hypothetical protein
LTDKHSTPERVAARRFPLNPVTLWRMGAPAALVGGLCAATYNWWSGGTFAWPKTIGVAAGAAIVTLTGYYLQPTLLRGDRLYVSNLWGFRQWLRLSDIATVTQKRYLRQPGFRIVASNGKAYWLSREIVRLGELHECIVTAAGESNPLAEALRTPLHQLE